MVRSRDQHRFSLRATWQVSSTAVRLESFTMSRGGMGEELSGECPNSIVFKARDPFAAPPDALSWTGSCAVPPHAPISANVTPIVVAGGETVKVGCIAAASTVFRISLWGGIDASVSSAATSCSPPFDVAGATDSAPFTTGDAVAGDAVQ